MIVPQSEAQMKCKRRRKTHLAPSTELDKKYLFLPSDDGFTCRRRIQVFLGNIGAVGAHAHADEGGLGVQSLIGALLGAPGVPGFSNEILVYTGA